MGAGLPFKVEAIDATTPFTADLVRVELEVWNAILARGQKLLRTRQTLQVIEFVSSFRYFYHRYGTVIKEEEGPA